MKHRLILTYLLNLFDLYCTMQFVKRYGIEVEANPIGRWMIQTGSVYAVKIGVVAVALFLLYHCILAQPRLKWASWLVLAIYATLAIYHLYIMEAIL